MKHWNTSGTFSGGAKTFLDMLQGGAKHFVDNLEGGQTLFSLTSIHLYSVLNENLSTLMQIWQKKSRFAHIFFLCLLIYWLLDVCSMEHS